MNSLYSITLLFGYIDEPIECYYYVCYIDGNTRVQGKEKNNLTKTLVEN